MASVEWVLADLREPGRPTVLSREGVPRARTSLSRALTDPFGARRARSIAAELDRWSRAPRGEKPREFVSDGIRCVPVPGTTAEVAAAWVAAGSAEGAEPPAAAAFTWDSDERRFCVPAESAALVGRRVVGDEPSTVLSADALRFVEVDDTIGLVQALLVPERGPWTGTATLRPGSDDLMRASVSMLPIGPSALSGVIFEAPNLPVTMRVESLAMDSIARVSNIHVVVMDVEKMRVLRWLTDPPSGIAWKGRRDNRDTPHPDDVRRIFRVASGVFTGEERRAALDGIRCDASRADGWWSMPPARSSTGPIHRW
ncbi:hypothetical protein [Williamsia herbipolensis]|uniref:hypothetical protein n=1 Tax=Williamsia herbipolensis TaxID=1603258 RepID=UPI0005F7EEDA|nr:hypothetical protein [Williamsia herbipolensis]